MTGAPPNGSGAESGASVAEAALTKGDRRLDEARVRAQRPAPIGLEETLLRAALLAGLGARARPLARRLAAVVPGPGDGGGAGRSCLEAGAPLQITVDAPGPAALRVGLRLGERPAEEPLAGLVGPEEARQLTALLAPLPAADHASLGAWLFWSEAGRTLAFDLRDPDPRDAHARLQAVLDREARHHLTRLASRLQGARPWALELDLAGGAGPEPAVHWLLPRGASPRDLAETVAPGRWPQAMDLLAHLLRRPERAGRWVITTPLDGPGEPPLVLSNTGWVLVPEDDAKHRAVGSLMAALGGPRSYAQALWSVLRQPATASWRVGRACQVRCGEEGDAARLFFTPQVSHERSVSAS